MRLHVSPARLSVSLVSVSLLAGCSSGPQEDPQVKRDRDRVAMRLETAQKSNEDATAQVAALQTRLDASTEELTARQMETSELQRQLADITRDRDAARTDATKAASLLTAAQKSSADSDTALKQAREQADTARVAADDATAKAARAEAGLKAAQDAGDVAQKTVQSQKQEIDRLNLQITALKEQAAEVNHPATTRPTK